MMLWGCVIAEGFLEKPTAFGVPLGALLLFLWLMRAIQESRQPSGRVQPSRSRQTARRSAGPLFSGLGFTASTEAIPLMGEVGADSVEFQRSGFKHEGGRAIVQFTVKLHESGEFCIAAGQHEAGRLLRTHYGYAHVSGSLGEVISGTVSCPDFTTGKWAIGAFRTAADIGLS